MTFRYIRSAWGAAALAFAAAAPPSWVLADAQESPTGGLPAPAASVAAAPSLLAAPQSEVQPTTVAGPGNAEEQAVAAVKAEPEKPWFMWENKAFTTTFVLTPIWDWATFSQDDANKQQVGEQATRSEWRAERINFAGKLKFKTPWTWQVGGNFNGFEVDEGDRLSFMDVRLDIPVPGLGVVKLGRQKVGVSQEWIMSGIDMVFMERSTMDLAFVPQRNVGVLVTDDFAQERGSWSVGAFNDWFSQGNDFAANGNQYTARLTYLPVYAYEGATFVLLAADAYYKEATNGTMQFRARPEVNEADYFLDTGKFDADHSLTTQIETAVAKGPFMAFAELSVTPVSAPGAGDPLFYGWYAAASYVLTGEHRGYNNRGGYYKNLKPSSPFNLTSGSTGAWEVGCRYTNTDLADGTVDGGRMSRWTGAVSWYPSRRWRIELNYGYSTLDKGGITGYTNALSTRLQWNLE